MAAAAAAAAKSLQLCPTLRPHRQQPTRLPSLGFSRQEHWNGLPFHSPMRESEKWKVKVKLLSSVQLLVTAWTAAHQAPPSMGFSRQEYWSRVPLPSPTSKWQTYSNILWWFQILFPSYYTGTSSWVRIFLKKCRMLILSQGRKRYVCMYIYI